MLYTLRLVAVILIRHFHTRAHVWAAEIQNKTTSKFSNLNILRHFLSRDISLSFLEVMKSVCVIKKQKNKNTGVATTDTFRDLQRVSVWEELTRLAASEHARVRWRHWQFQQLGGAKSVTAERRNFWTSQQVSQLKQKLRVPAEHGRLTSQRVSPGGKSFVP